MAQETPIEDLIIKTEETEEEFDLKDDDSIEIKTEAYERN